MAKLYFKYGAMGSSKTAQALITKFNYEERGMKVWLIKPSVDERDGVFTVKSRIGLTAEGTAISETCNIYEEMKNRPEHADVIIADEAQFFSREQIDELRDIVDELNVPVLCFGLRTDFLTHVFPGSGRLLEIADEFSEIKTMCEVPDIETEIFVHGALCMCVSGQCYMSAVIGSRSANRGGCAQACRLPFSAKGKPLADPEFLRGLPRPLTLGEVAARRR